MKKNWLVLSTGFALFSMFFGSGNLVFPITVGQESAGHYGMAALGILLTGVAVPFLGVLGMLLYQGDIYQFFNSFGRRGVFIFSFFALALMGPFGVFARCLTVAHGAMVQLFPTLSLPVSSLVLCGVIYLLAVNKNHIVSLLGTVLTPFLLISIGVIAYFGLTQGALPEASSASSWEPFKNGFFQGYQTMDLLAAFFFSQFVIGHLKQRDETDSPHMSSLTIFCQSAVVGAGILSAVYFVLVLLGWIYSPLLGGVAPQEMLGVIAQNALGPFAAPCLCIAVVFACLTTAIVLASLFADFLKKEVANDRISDSVALLTTLGIGFAISTLEFAGIARFLGPILETIYPALIVLTLVNIACKFLSVRASHWPFTLTIVAKLSAF
jgi:LIVCS family branched-chain amino acid:cation transporter